jgi:hypothetical protein
MVEELCWSVSRLLSKSIRIFLAMSGHNPYPIWFRWSTGQPWWWWWRPYHSLLLWPCLRVLVVVVFTVSICFPAVAPRFLLLCRLIHLVHSVQQQHCVSKSQETAEGCVAAARVVSTTGWWWKRGRSLRKELFTFSLIRKLELRILLWSNRGRRPSPGHFSPRKVRIWSLSVRAWRTRVWEFAKLWRRGLLCSARELFLENAS